MKTFENFVNILSVEFYRKMGWVEPDKLKLPPAVPAYRLIAGPFGEDRRVLALTLIVRGDEFQSDKISSQIELFKKMTLSGANSKIFVLYIFEHEIPFGVKDNIMLSGKEDFCCGYVDLAEGEIFLPSQARDFEEILKNSLAIWEKNIDISLTYKEIKKKTEIKDIKPLGTICLLVICILMFLWMTLAGGSTDTDVLIRFGANYGPLLKAGQWWRPVGSMFLHIGFIHIIVNMLALWNIGSALEKYYGTSKYLAVYTFSGIIGSLASSFSKNIVSAGASGAIFGLCGALAYLEYHYSRKTGFNLKRLLTGGILPCIGYNLLFGFMVPGIDNTAHMGGLIAGLVCAILINPIVLSKKNLSYYCKIFFLILAISPFLIETYVAYRAFVFESYVTSYPLMDYKDGKGKVLFKYPGILSGEKIAEGEKLSFPGLCLIIFNTADKKGITDIKKEADKLIAEINPKSPATEKSEIITVNQRKWLVTGTTIPVKEEAMPLKLFITDEENTLYYFVMITPVEKLNEGNNIMKLIMESFAGKK